MKVGDIVFINDQEFKIVGVWEKIGNPVDDQSFYVSNDVFEEVFASWDRVDYIYVRVADVDEIDKIAEGIKKELRENRNLEEGKEDF